MSRVFFVNAGFPGVGAVARAGERLGLWTLGLPRNPSRDDLVIFGAWHSSYSLPMRRLGCRKARLLTSSIAQMELSPNGVELHHLELDFRLLERGVLDFIFFGSRDAYEYYRRRSPRVHYFPYPLFFNPEPLDFSVKEHAVGLFLPNHPRKNIKTQLAAAELLGVKLYHNLDGFLPYPEYRSLLRRVKAVLHVSFTETLGYAVVEAVEAGTIPVFSPCVSDNLGLKHASLMVRNPDSVLEIKAALEEVLSWDEDTYSSVLLNLREKLNMKASHNNRMLKRLLEGL